MKTADIPEIALLSTPEKILLIEDLWDEISKDDSSIPIPKSHKNELDKRLKAFESSPGKLLTLKELQTRVGNRK